jgi:predicted phage baseplate assembly protein
MMALPTPVLDDRKFQDIVSEARSLIPRYCPGWTDHNLSDPGITMIELFAWMVDILLYRLNKVPEKNYVRFLDLMGIKLLPARPGAVDVTFRLSAPQDGPVTIPNGTEVATVRTEMQEAVAFTTEADLTVTVPHMVQCMISRGGTVFHDYLPVLKMRELMEIFQKVPQENDAFYVGYADNIGGNTLRLTFETSIEGIGVDPRNPPVMWEYWDGEENKWATVRLESDTTGGLNRDGEVIVHVPNSCQSTDVEGKNAFWVRCRAIKTRPRQPAYTTSPRVQGVTSHCIGGTVRASHAFRITEESLGISNGAPGQIFFLQNLPVLTRQAGETVEVESSGGIWEKWIEVIDFASSGPEDLHFTCDGANGEVQFGPRLRQPTGDMRQFGAIPPKGKRIRFSNYRCGGGVNGNVGERTLTVLKSSIPYVAWVTNFEAAVGGTDFETLDNAKLRAPQVLRSRVRAVTAEDYEYLAYEASNEVTRAKCLIPRTLEEKDGIPPGTIKVLIIPVIAGDTGQIGKEQLSLPEHLRKAVTDYLDERRLLTAQLTVSSPDYIWVAVDAKVKARVRTDQRRLKTEIERKLYHFVNPVNGGPDGTGWPFGRDLLASDLHVPLQEIAGVDYVEEIKLYPVDIETGKRGEATARVTFSSGQLPCSQQHSVSLV